MSTPFAARCKRKLQEREVQPQTGCHSRCHSKCHPASSTRTGIVRHHGLHWTEQEGGGVPRDGRRNDNPN
jgi:hypothetical protein